VIAYGGGGALDTVVEGVTGAFFHPQTPEALAETVASFDVEACDPAAIRRNAERFDTSAFKQALSRFVGEHSRAHAAGRILPRRALDP
jgi:hypothetical protein